MNKLLEYCQTRIKCEWILTKDFIFIGHYALNGILVETIVNNNPIYIMSTMPEGIVFYFNGKGFSANKAKLQKKIDENLKTDASYVIGSDKDRMSTNEKGLREVNLLNANNPIKLTRENIIKWQFYKNNLLSKVTYIETIKNPAIYTYLIAESSKIGKYYACVVFDLDNDKNIIFGKHFLGKFEVLREIETLQDLKDEMLKNHNIALVEYKECGFSKTVENIILKYKPKINIETRYL